LLIKYQPGSEVVLADDLRPSMLRMLAAVARAVEDGGYRLNFAGMIPSSAVALYAMQQGAASVRSLAYEIPLPDRSAS
jgi:phosphomannomutase